MKKGKRPDYETAKGSTTATKKKVVFKEKYLKSLNYGFIASRDSHAPSPLCVLPINDDRLSNEALKH